MESGVERRPEIVPLNMGPDLLAFMGHATVSKV